MMSGPDSTASVSDDAKDARKRTREESEELVLPEDLSKMSRSERKRHREKKRRSDVNKGFDDLMNLLIEIDPKVRIEAEERARRGQWKGSIGAQEDNLLSRVDLITRTVDVLRRVHGENEQRKELLDELTRGTRGGMAAAMPGGMAAAMPGGMAGRYPPVNDDIAMMSMLAGGAGNPLGGGGLARNAFEQSALYQQAALRQSAIDDQRNAAALMAQQSLRNPLAGASLGLQSSKFLMPQGQSSIVQQGGVMAPGIRPAPDLSSMADRNRTAGATISQAAYLQMLQDEAAAAASRLRGVGGANLQQGGGGAGPNGLPDGRRF